MARRSFALYHSIVRLNPSSNGMHALNPIIPTAVALAFQAATPGLLFAGVSTMRVLISIWCCALLAACAQDSGIPAPEDFVFVPAKDYSISVEIVVPHEAMAGEWIPLRATRRSGPWQRLRFAEVAPNTEWFVVPPPEYESEVADNLRWVTEPPDAARFDLPTTATAITHERKAMFSEPGVYRIVTNSKSTVEFGVTSQDLSSLGGAVTYEKGEIGNANVRVLVNPNQTRSADRQLDPNTFLGSLFWAGQNTRPRWQVQPFTDTISAWHEFGHAWGYINGAPTQVDPISLIWENRMRAMLYGPLGPMNAPRIRHK